MTEHKTIAEAMKVPGVVHIEAGSPVRAYLEGEKLPEHCCNEEQRRAWYPTLTQRAVDFVAGLFA